MSSMSEHRGLPLAGVIATLLASFLSVGTVGAEDAPVVPLRQAHAHNDYAHSRPLLDALDHGFCSVEADVFLVKDKLLVGHTFLELKPNRTLESLYLDPLLERVKRMVAESLRMVHRSFC